MMHPKTLDAFVALQARSPHHPVLSRVMRAHHFDVSRGIVDLARMTAEHEFDGWSIHGRHGHPPMPSTARLPGETIVLTFPDGAVFVLQKIGHSSVGVEFLAPFGAVVEIGNFDPINETSWSAPLSPDRTKNDRQQDFATLYHLAFVLSLINLPRKIVKTVETVSRQHRKRVLKVTGCASIGYTRIGWEVGSSVKARGRTAAGDGGVALHWSRAHFRRADEGEPKAEWLNLSEKGGLGWYTWVADSWKGDPAFGVKLQAHAPRAAGEPGPSAAKYPKFTASSAERLAMLDAQKAEAIRQAGLAA